MRVLCTFFARVGLGHFLPLVPVAAALRDAGHTVAFAAPASYASQIAAAGFDAVAAGANLIDPEVAPLLAERRALVGTAQLRAFGRVRLMAGPFVGRLASAGRPTLAS